MGASPPELTKYLGFQSIFLLDRDENATKNIAMVGMGHRHDLKWTGSDYQTTSVASCCEPSRIIVASAR